MNMGQGEEKRRAGSPSRPKSRIGLLSRVGNVPFLLVIYAYRVTLSPFIGGQCRYEPTCSWYGIEAYKQYGPIRGTWMTAGRILRCHPFAKGGYDPVPIRDGSGSGSYDEDAISQAKIGCDCSRGGHSIDTESEQRS